MHGAFFIPKYLWPGGKKQGGHSTGTGPIKRNVAERSQI